MSADTAAPPTAKTPSPSSRSGGTTLLGFVFAVISAVALFVMWDGHGNLWPLVFVGFVPMFIAAHRLLPRKLAPLAYAIATFGYFLALSLAAGGVLPAWLIYVAAVLLCLVWGVLGIFERRFAERTNYKWFIAQFALLWMVVELLAANNLIVGTNFWIEYRTAAAPWLAQPVSILSTPSWGFVIIMFNAAIALLIMKAMDRKWPSLADVPIPTRTVKWSSVIAGAVVIIWVISALLINASVNSSLGPTVRVAAIQSGIQNTTSSGELGEGGEQGTPDDNARNARLQVQLTAMTKQAAAQGAKLIVWPEEELDFDVRAGNKAEWIGALAKATGTTIVAGFMPDSPSLESPNLAAVWFPNGQRAAQVYSKEHQVIAEGEAFVAGNAPAVYPTDFGTLGVIICFDHDFPDSSSRATVLAGANIMAVPAIDPYSISSLRWQSLTYRALENRVPFVKTDVGFDSAIVNANGQLIKRVAIDTPAGSTTALVGDVNIGPRDAPFTQTGTYPLTAVAVLLLIARYIRQFYLYRRAKQQAA